ncbi:MAG: metallophosphoesterase [Phycisphaerae bacterium]|nr:metallophosphoesterase [Phycisphaerae bacterium]
MNNKSKQFLLYMILFAAFASINQFVFASDKWRFAVISDTQGNGSIAGNSQYVNIPILSEIVAAIINEDIDFILVCGDLVSGYPPSLNNLETQLTIWRNTVQPLYDAGIGVYPVRGNHDTYMPNNKASWDSVFSGQYALPGNGPSGQQNVTYSFINNNAMIVGLGFYTSGRHILNQQAWLDQQFASNDHPHIFVYGHPPAFEMYHVDSLAEINQSQFVLFWDSMVDAGVRSYFCGHDHFLNHARIDDGDGNPDNDIHQIEISSSGSLRAWDGSYSGDNLLWTPQLVYYDQKYGYMLVEVDDLNVNMTWKHRTAPGIFQAAPNVFSYAVPLRADINLDGKVNNLDFSIFASAWLSDAAPTANWNPECDISLPKDNVINLLDLNIICQDWLKETH